jgi:hypothetical protein
MQRSCFKKGSEMTHINNEAGSRRHRFEAAGGALGALSGAGLGVLAAGPPGAIVGALIGAAAGASAGWAHESATLERAQRDRELDAEIGVSGGDIGVPGLEHPPPTTGAFSAEASGAASVGSEQVSSEGPIQAPPE